MCDCSSHIYSDKSKTSLKESAFQYFPLHVPLLNFSHEYRRECIINGSTFLAFLPISLYKITDGVTSSAKVDRSQRLRLIHLAMDVVLKELHEVDYSGFGCEESERIRRRCHPYLVSYCPDLPECKDMSSIRNENRGERNCHRCLAQTGHFNHLATEAC